MRSTTQVLIGATLCLFSSSVFAQGAPGPALAAAVSPQVLQRDLEIMKQQLEDMQQKIRKQEELIKQLTTQPTPPPPVAQPSPEVEEQIRQKVREDIMREIQPSLSAATRTFPSLFNPAIGLVIDTVGSYTRDGGNFEFRSAELGLSAAVDPFARAYAFINGTQDSVEVEEAAIVTTSLPYNFTVKGGRFFADFGRLAHFHDHELPFVNRPIVLDQYVDGESQADGVEVSWLAPTSQYFNLTAGMYNKIGKDMARAIADGLARNYPDHTPTFQRNLVSYLATLDAAIARWEREAVPLRGLKLVSYHPDMIYFAERFGMEAVGTIEIRAGIDPTPGHIVALEDMMSRQGVKLVVRELHYPAGLAATVAQHTGATLVELPAMVGGVPEAKDYLSFINYNVQTMLKAASTINADRN
jgi:Zinc-uptake complex component A periplasmic